MANSLGDVRVDLSLASSKFEQGLQAAGRNLNSFNNDIGKMKGAVSGLAGALAVGAFAAWIKQSIDAADSAAKTAQSIGLTTEALTGLQFAAGLSGMNNERLSDTLKDLNKNIYEAVKGAKTQAETFKALGVEVTDANGNIRSADAVLLDVADRFKATSDGADKTAVAMKLFGEGGRAMIPMLNQGSEGIEAMTARAERLGLVLDSQTTKAAEQFNDNLTIVQGVTRGLANNIMKEMLPTLNHLTDEFVNLAESGTTAKDAAQLLADTMKVLVTAGVVAKTAFSAVADTLGTVGAAVVAAASGDFRVAAQILEDFANEVPEDMGAAAASVQKIWDETAQAANEGAREQLAAFMRVQEGAQAASDEQAKAAQKVADAINKQLEALKMEAATVGMTKAEIALYRLEMEGATAAQLESAKASLNVVASFEAQKKAIEEAAKARKAAIEQAAEEGSRVTGNFNSAVADLDSYRTGNMSEADRERERHAESLAALEEFGQQNHEMRAYVNDLIEQEQRRHSATMAAIGQAEMQQRLDQASMIFGNLSTLMNTQSKKMFQIGKMAAIANAVVNTAQGVTQALANLPPPISFAAAASVAAAGAVQIATIRSQQFGGGGTVSSAGGSPGVYRPPQPSVPSGPASPSASQSPGGVNGNITIVNNTSSRIAKVSERQISPTERAIIIEEAKQAVAADMSNPNSTVSRSMSRNMNVQRAR